jgi:glycosyltransferase involved in cell wall biosynthesis
MACGLPVIVSSANGTSEIITNGMDGLVLEDPRDDKTLASMIRRLYEDQELCERLGQNATSTARRYTWERNALEIRAIFEKVLREKQALLAVRLSD